MQALVNYLHYPAAMYTLVPPADLLIAGHFEEEPGFTVYRERGARNWMIALTVEGRAIYRVGEREFTAERGAMVLVSPGTMHHYFGTGDEYWEYWWAHFQPRPAWVTWWRELPERAPGFYLTSFAPELVRQAVDAFARVHRYALFSTVDTDEGRVVEGPSELGGAVGGELALNGIEQLLLLAVAELESRRRHSPDPRVQRILEVISTDPARQHSVEDLARLVSLSPSRLAHLFRRDVGDSIINVVVALRLRQAARLLEFTDRPIGTVAANVGFSSPYYFSRQFRQRFGVPPTTYRAHAQR
jgi:AraC family transcriptional regulator, arabinose operon regulatory protein